MIDVSVIGSANVDLVARADRHPLPGETVIGTSYVEFPGGKGLNQAVAAARSGASTALIGALGCDAAGDALRAVAAAEQIDLSGLTTVDEFPTGRALITVAESGENSIVVVPGANAELAVPHVGPSRVVLAQLEVPLDAVAHGLVAARRQGALTILNPAPATDLPDALLSACDIIIPNEHEIGLLGGIAALFGAGVGTVIVTRGAAGAEIHTGPGHVVAVSAPAVDVVDTTGAGDTFCGALAARLAAGHDLTAATRWAVAAASLAVTDHGAIPAIPGAMDIERLFSA